MYDKRQNRNTKAAGSVDPIDAHVGGRLKARRLLVGMSQEKLADALGITFQQVQKYENGSNRVGASRLFTVGQALGVPVGYFFENYGDDMPDMMVAEAQGDLSGKSSASSVRGGMPAGDVMSRKETVDLVKAYYAIEDEDLRKKVLVMVQGFGK